MIDSVRRRDYVRGDYAEEIIRERFHDNLTIVRLHVPDIRENQLCRVTAQLMEVSRASTGSNRLLEVLSEVDRGLRGSPLRLIVPNASDGGPP